MDEQKAVNQGVKGCFDFSKLPLNYFKSKFTPFQQLLSRHINPVTYWGNLYLPLVLQPFGGRLGLLQVRYCKEVAYMEEVMGLNFVWQRARKYDRESRDRRWRQIKPIDQGYSASRLN